MIERDLAPPVVNVGNLNALRTYADVRDIVRAYYMLLTVNPQPAEVYEIAGTHTCTIGEMLQTLIDLSTAKNIDVHVDKDRLRPIDTDLQAPDTFTFMQDSGWKPEIPFEKTMADLLDYWRQRISTTSQLRTR